MSKTKTTFTRTHKTKIQQSKLLSLSNIFGALDIPFYRNLTIKLSPTYTTQYTQKLHETTHLSRKFSSFVTFYLLRQNQKSVEISKFLFKFTSKFSCGFLDIFFRHISHLYHWYTQPLPKLYHFFIFMTILSLLHFSLFEFGVWKILYSNSHKLICFGLNVKIVSIQTNRFFIHQ